MPSEPPFPGNGRLGGSSHSRARATKATEIEVVGQTGENRCRSNQRCKATWRQEADGLHVRAMFAQRPYTDCKWPDPIAIRITHARPVAEAVPEILKSQKESQRLLKTEGAK
jgi:alpha-L-fucosidase